MKSGPVELMTGFGYQGDALMARWQSGYVAACKAVYTGSIPVRASKASIPAPLPRRRPGWNPLESS